MKYITILFLLIIAVYPLSYAKYSWGRKNRLGAVGAAFIALAAVVFPSLLIVLR